MSVKSRAICMVMKCRRMKMRMSSSGFRSLVGVCPSAGIEDVMKSFELIVMPRLRYNK